MAKLTPGFSVEAERIHREHGSLLHFLGQLDRALDHLPAGAAEDAEALNQVQLYGRLLAAGLPEHFLREEKTLLDTVSDISPQLAQFAREMKREHEALCVRLAEFCRLLEEFQDADDRPAALASMHQQGKQLTGELGRHIAAEEHELSGFL